MAEYLTTIVVPCSVAETFAYVSNFHNAAKWDPRTYSAEKVTPGPVGLGTIFVLRGGMLPKGTLPRFIPDSVVAQPLPYEVKTFTENERFVLAGETPVFTYRDELEFKAVPGGTSLRYAADLSFKGIFKLGEPILRLMFNRIGDDATAGIAAAVQRSAKGGAAA